MGLDAVNSQTIALSILASILSSGFIVYVLQSLKESRKEHNMRVEELYLAFHRWVLMIHMAWIYEKAWLDDKMSIDEANEHVGKISHEGNPHERVMVLTEVYFPQLVRHTDAVRSLIDQTRTVFEKAKNIMEEDVGAKMRKSNEFAQLVLKLNPIANIAKAQISSLRK